MKYIELTQGQKTIVDDEDYELLNKHKWLAHLNYLGKYYPERAIKGKIFRMYWAIIGKPKKGFCVDHIDGNPLNNQKSNLRICTNSQNQANRGPMSHNKLGVKGVHRYVHDIGGLPTYRAQIKKNGKVKNLGYFHSIEEAQKAYIEAAKEVHGEFARV